MEKLVELITSGNIHNVIVMAGAGISVASGIPDFRSPQVGLYASIKNVAELHHHDPTFVFQLEVFEKDPKPFWWIFSKMWPATAAALPTQFHFLISLLYSHNLLLRCYTQNIDGLEKLAGVPDEKVIHAHGVLDKCHCLKCGKEYPIGYCIPQMNANLANPNATIENAICPVCTSCGSSLIKPDVVFFHEDLPDEFFDQFPIDFEKADLLIIAGTSLEVYPFASLPGKVNHDVPRFLINKTMVKNSRKFNFSSDRDWFIPGDCQVFAKDLCEVLGWDLSLKTLIANRVTIGHKWSIPTPMINQNLNQGQNQVQPNPTQQNLNQNQIQPNLIQNQTQPNLIEQNQTQQNLIQNQIIQNPIQQNSFQPILNQNIPQNQFHL